MPTSDTIAVPTSCVLEHRAFSSFGPVSFRRSPTDQAPVMVVQLGDREAMVPLRALQRELGIEDDSGDGRMLALIVEALDFVSSLAPGDKLPSEVLTGQASWQPDAVHLRLAAARIRMQLAAWLGGEAEATALAEPQAMMTLAEDPTHRQKVQQAFARAAEELGLPDSSEVVALVEDLARELGYIEALRDRLLRRVQEVCVRLELLFKGWRGDSSHLETLTQVRRLSALALRQISSRFDELDAQTGEVVSALRNAESQRVFIRSNRDWLYRSLLSWQPILTEWATPPLQLDETAWSLLARTYKFLAPRYMPVTEWTLMNRQPRRRERDVPKLVW